MADLPEILRCSCEHQRGVGNSFQPAIDASRIHLTNCVIAPSAKILKNRNRGGFVLSHEKFFVN
jgi:hypothetical protein